MKLVDAKPIGTKKSLVHLNRGSHPHSWEMRDFPVYPEYPDGVRLKETRFALGLTQSQAAKRLGMSVVDYSQLEHGRKVLESAQDLDCIIVGLEGHE